MWGLLNLLMVAKYFNTENRDWGTFFDFYPSQTGWPCMAILFLFPSFYERHRDSIITFFTCSVFLYRAKVVIGFDRVLLVAFVVPTFYATGFPSRFMLPRRAPQQPTSRPHCLPAAQQTRPAACSNPRPLRILFQSTKVAEPFLLEVLIPAWPLPIHKLLLHCTVFLLAAVVVPYGIGSWILRRLSDTDAAKSVAADYQPMVVERSKASSPPLATSAAATPSLQPVEV